MNFYQRAKGNDKWIKKFGCAFISVIYQVYKFYNFGNKLNITLNEWYQIFKDNNLFTKDGYLIWYRISSVFPDVEADTYLWSGKHKDIDLIDKHSIVSVDYKQEHKYLHPHFMPVIDFLNNSIKDLFVYNSYYDLIELVSDRYIINDNLKESIFSIVNLNFNN